MKVFDLLKKGQGELASAGIIGTDARLLMEDLLNLDTASLLLHYQDELEGRLMNQYLHNIDLRKEHCPIQYILGYQYFCELKFQVNKNVLIPREETESLVEDVFQMIIDKLRKHVSGNHKEKANFNILDMCTGSGCIAISLAVKLDKHLEGNKEIADYIDKITITGVDISEEALIIAKANHKNLCQSDSTIKLQWCQSNLFTNVDGNELYDIIVSNPPYIVKEELSELMPEVRNHEPMVALDGGNNGLDFYNVITEEGMKYLKPEGALCFEIGYDQGKTVPDIMKVNGYGQVTMKCDFMNIPRNVYGIRVE